MVEEVKQRGKGEGKRERGERKRKIRKIVQEHMLNLYFMCRREKRRRIIKNWRKGERQEEKEYSAKGRRREKELK